MKKIFFTLALSGFGLATVSFAEQAVEEAPACGTDAPPTVVSEVPS